MSNSFVTTWTVACQLPLSMGFPRLCDNLEGWIGEVGREFRREGTCIPVASSCWCIAKNPQYCKVIVLQLKIYIIKNIKRKKKNKRNTGVSCISFSRGSSPPRDWTCISCIGWQIIYHWATREAPISCLALNLTCLFFSQLSKAHLKKKKHL